MSVDVVVPCFNGEKHLRATLESALSQTYSPLRVLVVDDGSTDGSRQVVESFGDRVGYVFKRNGGQASARNLGVASTTADHVCLLDADDILAPRMVERLVARLEADPEADLVHCATLDFDGEDLAHPFAANWRPAVAWASYLEPLSLICAIHGSSTLLRRRAFERYGGFPEARSLQGCEDWHFWLQAALGGARILFEPQPLCFYRQHAGASSASSQAIARREAELIGRAAEMFEHHGVRDERHRIFLAAGTASIAARWICPGGDERFATLYEAARSLAPERLREPHLPPLSRKVGTADATRLHLSLAGALLEQGSPHLAAVLFLRAGDGREVAARMRAVGGQAELDSLCAAMQEVVETELVKVAETGVPSYASHLALALAKLARERRDRGAASRCLEEARRLDPGQRAPVLESIVFDLREGRTRSAIASARQVGRSRPWAVARFLTSKLVWSTLRRVGLKPVVERWLFAIGAARDRRRLRKRRLPVEA